MSGSGLGGASDWSGPVGPPPGTEPSVLIRLLRLLGAVVLGAPGMMLMMSGPIVMVEGNPVLGIPLFLGGVALMAAGFWVFRGKKDRTPMNLDPYG